MSLLDLLEAARYIEQQERRFQAGKCQHQRSRSRGAHSTRTRHERNRLGWARDRCSRQSAARRCSEPTPDALDLERHAAAPPPARHAPTPHVNKGSLKFADYKRHCPHVIRYPTLINLFTTAVLLARWLTPTRGAECVFAWLGTLYTY